jgi:O-antigen/teichoic acid export membrane protein
VLELGVTGIAIGALASSSIFAFLLWVTVLWPVGVYLNLEVARKLFKLSWPLWVAAFAALYIGSANRYYLRIFGSMEDIGLFELATKFSGIVSLLIWQPFAQYWHIERYKCYQQVGAKLVFQDAFRFISTVLTVGALGVGIFGGPVIHIMSEEAFHGASGSVPFLAFGTAFYCLSEFSNFSFVIKEKTIWISRITYLTGGMITVLYLIFIPWLGHVGAALAFMLAQGIMFLTVQCVGRQFYDMGIKMKQLAMMLIVAGGAIWLSNGIVILEGLIEDIAVKTIIYLSACVIICLPLWKNFGGQVIFENFLNRFSRMVRLKKE